MKIYTDISNIASVPFLTGIQRVVKELLIRLADSGRYDINFLIWNATGCFFCVADYDSAMRKLHGSGEKVTLSGERWVYSEADRKALEESLGITAEIADDMIFLDLDAVWHSLAKRSWLYPQLKSHGVRIVTLVYDVIPVIFPEYVHRDTIFRFYSYLTSVLQYSDIILTNAEATRADIESILQKADAPKNDIRIITLGADFETRDSADRVLPDAERAVKAGKYVLTVGTVEPRKNHAHLLDAFDHFLANCDINLVIAGKIGWNVEELEKRIRGHELLGKRVFFIEGANNETIEYLYRNAFLFAFPSYAEGFGLPIIEALSADVPVIVSDISVFHETCGETAEYFSPDDAEGFSGLVKKFLTDEDFYAEKKRLIAVYKKPTWDDAAFGIEKIIDEVSFPHLDVPSYVEQVFILSARTDDLFAVLPFIEYYMPFINKVLIACPGAMKPEVEAKYGGALTLEFLTDEENLAGRDLPEDHETRNFFLRCLAMRSEKLDDSFIMYDDDYRPLLEISVDDFIRDGKYRAYFFYDLAEWEGRAEDPTSFDRGMYRTLKFLNENGYPTLQYSSHMPQVINKRVYQELLTKHPGIERMGLDEWSVYFNFAFSTYPKYFTNERYKTLCWPGTPKDWDVMEIPREYLFENHYLSLYGKGAMFYGQNRYLGTPRINFRKILVRHSAQLERARLIAADRALDLAYGKEHGSPPLYALIIIDGAVRLVVPEKFHGQSNFMKKISVAVEIPIPMKKEEWGCVFAYRFETMEGEPVGSFAYVGIGYGVKSASIPVQIPPMTGDYLIHFVCELKTPAELTEVTIPAWIYDV